MVVSYLGTKGGTGTTTLAVNGAADIRRLTRKPTVIVDLKTGPGDVSLFLGLRPRHSVLDAIDHLSWMRPARARGRRRVWPARLARCRWH